VTFHRPLRSHYYFYILRFLVKNTLERRVCCLIFPYNFINWVCRMNKMISLVSREIKTDLFSLKMPRTKNVPRKRTYLKATYLVLSVESVNYLMLIPLHRFIQIVNSTVYFTIVPHFGFLTCHLFSKLHQSLIFLYYRNILVGWCQKISLNSLSCILCDSYCQYCAK
jgi:hypothetical protein